MARYTYGFSRDLSLPYSLAVDATARALKETGFQISAMTGQSEDGRRYTLFTILDPDLMSSALALSPDLGLGLPAHALIWEREGQTCTVCITDPYQALPGQVSPALVSPLGQALNARLWRAYLAVTTQAAGTPVQRAQRA